MSEIDEENTLTFEGAHTLKARIEAYWQRQGQTVPGLRVEQIVHRKRPLFVVRSNLKLVVPR